MQQKFHYLITGNKYGEYISEIIELPGCNAHAKSFDELKIRTKEAILSHLLENKEISKTKFIGIHIIEVN